LNRINTTTKTIQRYLENGWENIDKEITIEFITRELNEVVWAIYINTP